MQQKSTFFASFFFLVIFLQLDPAASLASDKKFPPQKLVWGEVSEEEWALSSCSYDSLAEAVALADIGNISFTYPNGEAVFTRHLRLKTLKKGDSYKNIVIPIYRLENLEEVKAQVLYWENGALITKRVEKEDVHVEHLSKNWKRLKFAFPNAPVGAVFEYSISYEIEDIVRLEAWTFENPFPTLYSAFSFALDKRLRLEYRMLPEGQKIRALISQNQQNNLWELQNLPALRDEPGVAYYLAGSNRLAFQLDKYTHVEKGRINLMQSWESIGREILGSHPYVDFQQAAAVQEILDATNFTDGMGAQESVEAIFQTLAKRLSWTGWRGAFPDKTMKELLQTNMGNGAALNMALVACVQTLGYEAWPVVLSTKAHGPLDRSIPFADQFNHAIMAFVFNDEILLYDLAAWQPIPSLIPVQAAVANALLLKKDNFLWLDLEKQLSSWVEKRQLLYQLGTEQIQLSGKIYLQGYSQQLFSGTKALEEAVKAWLFSAEEQSNWEKQALSMKSLEQGSGTVISFSYATAIENFGRFVSLSPLQSLRIADTDILPTDGLRIMPYDIMADQLQEITITVVCANGQRIDGLPDNGQYSLPDNGGHVLRVKKLNDQQAQLQFKSSIKAGTIAQKQVETLLQMSIAQQQLSQQEIIIDRGDHL